MIIWKYPVCQSSEFSRMMPQGAKFLSVQLQHEDVQMWFLVDPHEFMEPKAFRVISAGEHFGERAEGDLTYLGTFQQGNFVYHLFEKNT